MAWSAPRTWVTGELVTSTIMNQHVRDNFLAINSIPACRAYSSINQGPIAANAWSAIPLPSERYDTDVIHDLVTNPSRLTCKTAGKYQIGASVQMGATAAGAVKQAALTVNNATWIAQSNHGAPYTQVGNFILSTQYQLAVNDYIELQCHPAASADCTIITSANISPEVWMQRLSD